MTQDIIIRVEGKAGRITLNRPDSLNALTYQMVLDIEQALLKWREDDGVHLVMIDAVGEKAFCAGGDVQKLYDTGVAGDYHYMRKFWADEYRLNAMIANYPKPYVAFMDGIVMGGGVGVSAHGSHRIVTERTMLAMPECAIGLVPDVGGSFLLAKAPGNVGEYMGMTGARLNGADAIYAGFGDSLVEIEELEALKAALISKGDVGVIGEHTQASNDSALEENRSLIDSYFAADSAIEIVEKLEASSSEWAVKQAKLIRRACPLSVACSLQMTRQARSFESVEQALENEYRFTYRSMIEGDVLEGVRALIVDKDRNPQWKVKRLEEVTDEMVSSMLTSLGNEELRLGENA